MVLFLVLHITRVYLTGALIWITGIMVASRTVGFGVSGYSLALDQVAYWGSKIVTSSIFFKHLTEGFIAI